MIKEIKKKRGLKMTYSKLIFLIIMSFLSKGCSSTDVNFLGASKYASNGYYAERWFLNPKYHESEIPHGKNFYGAAAQKIKHKFIIKYYVDHKDGTIEEIPINHMWEIKPNPSKQYYYVKEDNPFNAKVYKRSQHYINKFQKKVPVKRCNADGYCELYPTPLIGKTLYIKESNIYKPKQK